MVYILHAPEERAHAAGAFLEEKSHPTFGTQVIRTRTRQLCSSSKGGKAGKLREVKQTYEHSQPFVQDRVLRGSPHQIKSSLRTALALPLDLSVCSLGDKP